MAFSVRSAFSRGSRSKQSAQVPEPKSDADANVTADGTDTTDDGEIRHDEGAENSVATGSAKASSATAGNAKTGSVKAKRTAERHSRRIIVTEVVPPAVEIEKAKEAREAAREARESRESKSADSSTQPRRRRKTAPTRTTHTDPTLSTLTDALSGTGAFATDVPSHGRAHTRRRVDDAVRSADSQSAADVRSMDENSAIVQSKQFGQSGQSARAAQFDRETDSDRMAPADRTTPSDRAMSSARITPSSRTTSTSSSDSDRARSGQAAQSRQPMRRSARTSRVARNPAAQPDRSAQPTQSAQEQPVQSIRSAQPTHAQSTHAQSAHSQSVHAEQSTHARPARPALSVHQPIATPPTVADEAERLIERFRLQRPHTQPLDMPPTLREIVREAEIHLNTDLAWYRALNDADRLQLRAIIETAVADFVDWFAKIDTSAFSDTLIRERQATHGAAEATNDTGATTSNSTGATTSGTTTSGSTTSSTGITTHTATARPNRKSNDKTNKSASVNDATSTTANPNQCNASDGMNGAAPKPFNPDTIDDALLHPSTDHIFFVAPLEFTKSITLNQTVELTRFIVDVMERNVTSIAKPGREQDIRNAMLYYSREVAFSAATVYASSAQARGDWDARLEALTIADLLDGVTSHQVSSRMSLLGWSSEFRCFAMAGHMHDHTGEISLSMAHRQIREAVRSLGGECLIGEHETLMVALIDPRDGGEPEDYYQAVADYFTDDSPVSIGPVREGLDGAAYTLRAAVNSHRASRCLTDLPRPLRSDDVLPERALLGDADARRELYDNVYSVLRGDDTTNPLLLTLSTFLRSGNSLDATARELNVHPNTVRYRLKRSVEVTGWDPMNPREAYVLLTAIKIGLMLDD
ncbi:PucR family transcriptional regulator [Bifidobacterium callimiconis]|nr:helix-turn-helix domain-containing protein [Bifidobacterium callimiconis]